VVPEEEEEKVRLYKLDQSIISRQYSSLAGQQSRGPGLEPLPAYVGFLLVKVAGTGFSEITLVFPYK